MLEGLLAHVIPHLGRDLSIPYVQCCEHYMSQFAKCLEWSQCSVSSHWSLPFYYNEERINEERNLQMKVQTSFASLDSVLCASESEQMCIERNQSAVMCLLTQVITDDSRRALKPSYRGL